MSAGSPDERLRALRRRADESGARDDEARFLADALRAGQVGAGALEVAAALGDDAAADALGIRAGEAGPTGALALRWLERDGDRAAVRFAAGVLAGLDQGPQAALVALAARAALAWCDEPSERSATEAKDASRRASRAWRRSRDAIAGPPPEVLRLACAMNVADAAFEAHARGERAVPQDNLARWLDGALSALVRLARLEPPLVRDAVGRALRRLAGPG